VGSKFATIQVDQNVQIRREPRDICQDVSGGGGAFTVTAVADG